MMKSVMSKLDLVFEDSKFIDADSLDKETFENIIKENKQLISDIKQTVKKFKSNGEHKDSLMITNDNSVLHTPEKNGTFAKKNSCILSLPDVTNSTVSVFLSPQISKLELSQKEFEEPKGIYESTEVMQKLFKECMGEVCKKIKSRANDVLRQCYYTQKRQISNISNQTRIKDSDKKDIAEMMYSKLSGISGKTRRKRQKVEIGSKMKGRNRSAL